jgi:hypothetical protein
MGNSFEKPSLIDLFGFLVESEGSPSEWKTSSPESSLKSVFLLEETT